MARKFSYDPTTPDGRVRLLVGDTVFGPTGDEPTFRFSDDEITAFLAMGSQDVDLATSLAYRQMAGSIGAAGAVEVKVGPVTEKYDAAKLGQLADQFAARARDAAGATEEIDTLDFVIDGLGRDLSEYVGDL